MSGENPEKVYQCKFCNQTFSSGPMLGGHMRSHKGKNQLEREPPLVIDDSSKEERRLGYFLRENPKKSWKVAGLKENAPENPCPVCEERFGSMRALFVHMKIHSRKDDESGNWCEDRGKGSGSMKSGLGKGSGSMKSGRDHTRPIHKRKRLNLSLLNEDGFVGSSKTKSDLLLIVLSDDETMRMTRRKRTPRVPYDVNERIEGVLLSVPNGFSCSSEAEQDVECIAVTLMMMKRGETDYNSSGFGVKSFGKSSAPDFFDVGKGRITGESKCNESHSRVYSRTELQGVESEVPIGMLCGAREGKHKKPKAARSGEEPMYEAAMMDRKAMGIADSDSSKRAELWIEPGLTSYRDKVRAEESQVFGKSGEENNYKRRDAESYKQEAAVDAGQGIEGNCGCAELESIDGDLEKVNRHACSMGCVRSDSLSTP